MLLLVLELDMLLLVLDLYVLPLDLDLWLDRHFPSKEGKDSSLRVGDGKANLAYRVKGWSYLPSKQTLFLLLFLLRERSSPNWRIQHVKIGRRLLDPNTWMSLPVPPMQTYSAKVSYRV